VIIRLPIDDVALVDAVRVTLDILRRRPHHEETSEALDHALTLASSGPATPERVGILGAGWVAEEALAIGVYAALAYDEDERGYRSLVVAVNHSGDCDSTGSICGNLIGAQYGSAALPVDWVEKVEGRQTIWELSLAFAQEFQNPPTMTKSARSQRSLGKGNQTALTRTTMPATATKRAVRTWSGVTEFDAVAVWNRSSVW
jgi:hypothetical protein